MGSINILIYIFFMFQSFYRLGSALMALKHYDRALEILKDGLNIKATDEEKYDIFKKIMELAFNAGGIL